jgi:hypothetical protein
MRFAEKEVESMEKQAVEEAEKEGRTLPPGEIVLPNFKELQAKKRAEAEKKFLEERDLLERNMSDIDKQILQIQKALRDIDGGQTIDSFFAKTDKAENNHRREESKKIRIEDVTKKRKTSFDNEREGNGNGAVGPEGNFVEFPEYDGREEPNESKKAFTLFCKRTRKEVKNSLSVSERKDKVCILASFVLTLFPWQLVPTLLFHSTDLLFSWCVQGHVNGILKDRWDALTEDEKQVWKEWEDWDAKRYEYQLGVYEGNRHGSPKRSKNGEDGALTVPKKTSDANNKSVLDRSTSNSSGTFSIPKRRNT